MLIQRTQQVPLLKYIVFRPLNYPEKNSYFFLSIQTFVTKQEQQDLNMLRIYQIYFQ